MIRPPPRSTLFPYTRSSDLHGDVDPADDRIGERRLRDRADYRAGGEGRAQSRKYREGIARARLQGANREDRKSTRLNSSHPSISYAVFCLKKKKKRITSRQR